jgi:hypothetical protein
VCPTLQHLSSLGGKGDEAQGVLPPTFLHFANLAKVDIILVEHGVAGQSRVVNHTSYTFTAAGTQRRLARVQLDLRRVRERERPLSAAFLMRESIFPSPRVRSRRRDLESSNANLLCNAYSCRLARSLAPSKPQQLLRVYVQWIRVLFLASKAFFQRPLRAEYSLRETHTRTHSVSMYLGKRSSAADLQCA